MEEVELLGVSKRHLLKTKREDLAWESQMHTLILQRQQTNIPFLLECCNTYLDFSKKKHISKTYAEKRIAFSVFFSSGFAADAGVDTLDRRSLLRHFQEQALKRSGNAANKDRKNLLAAWTWGVKFLSLPSQNPFAFVPKQSEQRFPRRVFVTGVLGGLQCCDDWTGQTDAPAFPVHWRSPVGVVRAAVARCGF